MLPLATGDACLFPIATMALLPFSRFESEEREGHDRRVRRCMTERGGAFTWGRGAPLHGGTRGVVSTYGELRERERERER